MNNNDNRRVTTTSAMPAAEDEKTNFGWYIWVSLLHVRCQRQLFTESVFSAVPNSAGGYHRAGDRLSPPAICRSPLPPPARSRRSRGTPEPPPPKLLRLSRAAGGPNRPGFHPSPAPRQVSPGGGPAVTIRTHTTRTHRHTPPPPSSGPPRRGGRIARRGAFRSRKRCPVRSSPIRPGAAGGGRLRKRRARTCLGPAQSRSRTGRRVRGRPGPAQSGSGAPGTGLGAVPRRRPLFPAALT